jgi:hypothetical protein
MRCSTDAVRVGAVRWPSMPVSLLLPDPGRVIQPALSITISFSDDVGKGKFDFDKAGAGSGPHARLAANTLA